MHSKLFIRTLALITLLLSTTAWSLESGDIETPSALDPQSTNGISDPTENKGVTNQRYRRHKRSFAAKPSTEKKVLQQNTTVTADPAIITEDKAARNKALEMEAHLKQLEQQINTLQNVQHLQNVQQNVLQQNTEKAAEQTTPPLGVVLQPYYISAIAFIIGFLSLLGWQTWQKREPKERFFTQSLFMSTKKTPPSQSVDTTPIPAIKAEVPLEFLAELNILNANQNPVNLLSEVDIYISHGYYHTAEELLCRAMQQQPIPDEYKLKLLKIYYTSGNKSQFENYINELNNTGKLKEHPFWNIIADMVKVLIPDSPLLTTYKPSISDQKQNDLNDRIAQETLEDELEYNFDFSEPH